jgi:hypothetical protein
MLFNHAQLQNVTHLSAWTWPGSCGANDHCQPKLGEKRLVLNQSSFSSNVAQKLRISVQLLFQRRIETERFVAML